MSDSEQQSPRHASIIAAAAAATSLFLSAPFICTPAGLKQILIRGVAGVTPAGRR